MKADELKDFLDFKAEQYEKAEFLQSDPIQLPHRFTQKEDIEIVAFLVSTIAWGNRKSIIQSGEKLISIMENDPFNFVKNYAVGDVFNSDFVHRTFNSQDLNCFFLSLQRLYKGKGLEAAFEKVKPTDTIKDRIHNFRNAFFQDVDSTRTFKHVSDPMKNSAAKRLNMFLRWLVRSNLKGVDFGLWKSINPSELYLPLDVHTSNNARKIGILNRKQDDWKALEELMSILRKMDPNDPVKYDFALFGLGAFEKF